jgi:uncharacterized protein YeaO (DUF488 family)
MITIGWTINNKMIKTKRASKFVPAEDSDGKRLLIVFDPHWAKFHKVPFHKHTPILGPSKGLWKAYVKFKQITWEEYERRFREDIAKNEKAQDLIKELAKKYCNSETEHVTLLCFCPDERYCHRRLVKEMILSNNQSIIQ